MLPEGGDQEAKSPAVSELHNEPPPQNMPSRVPSRDREVLGSHCGTLVFLVML